VIAFELLSGARPFDEPSPKELPLDISPDVSRLIDTCLSRDPQARPAASTSAALLKTAVEERARLGR
jgi:hypothetical protein